MDHDLIGVAGAQRGNERLVDFQFVHRQFLEIGQSRLAGALVVDREANAKRTQISQGRNRRRPRANDRALSDLKAE